MGAWIEIFINTLGFGDGFMSLPVWGRGLKSDLTKIQLNKDVVAPRVGAWIEIMI